MFTSKTIAAKKVEEDDLILIFSEYSDLIKFLIDDKKLIHASKKYITKPKQQEGRKLMISTPTKNNLQFVCKIKEKTNDSTPITSTQDTLNQVDLLEKYNNLNLNKTDLNPINVPQNNLNIVKNNVQTNTTKLNTEVVRNNMQPDTTKLNPNIIKNNIQTDATKQNPNVIRNNMQTNTTKQNTEAINRKVIQNNLMKNNHYIRRNERRKMYNKISQQSNNNILNRQLETNYNTSSKKVVKEFDNNPIKFK